ncbi:hypothetical protein K469DRAFT_723600 [Zopfia rhizophila CBS 207.26]|uniref:Uncharacterized protein n=1 Tax=Zopfia rhizophila CBS 207.26 TaxID=1314779 RepID=A0A6A6EEI0_9PEZI|nr:hypothetical protein K469DRAFT_723600 [Zopfia rhizophila CBS 207.26]
MSDADGDSQMHSSPELEADDEMFPDEAGGPSTPRNAAAFSLEPASELSPPNSQGPSHLASRDESVSTALSGSPSTLNANGKRVHPSGLPTATSSLASSNIHVDEETGYTWAKQEDQPGYEWKNPRAREEESRALDQIIDKGAMIKLRYGDPLDPNVPMKRR